MLFAQQKRKGTRGTAGFEKRVKIQVSRPTSDFSLNFRK